MIIRTYSSQFFGYHMQDSPVYNLGNYHQNNEQVNYTYSPWLKKSLDFNCLKCSKMKNLSQFLTEYLHHGCRKFCISIVWNAPKWRIWASSLQNVFIMVEENFVFQLSEMPKNEEISKLTQKYRR